MICTLLHVEKWFQENMYLIYRRGVTAWTGLFLISNHKLPGASSIPVSICVLSYSAVFFSRLIAYYCYLKGTAVIFFKIQDLSERNGANRFEANPDGNREANSQVYKQYFAKHTRTWHVCFVFWRFWAHRTWIHESPSVMIVWK